MEANGDPVAAQLRALLLSGEEPVDSADHLVVLDVLAEVNVFGLHLESKEFDLADG